MNPVATKTNQARSLTAAAEVPGGALMIQGGDFGSATKPKCRQLIAEMLKARKIQDLYKQPRQWQQTPSATLGRRTIPGSGFFKNPQGVACAALPAAVISCTNLLGSRAWDNLGDTIKAGAGKTCKALTTSSRRSSFGDPLSKCGGIVTTTEVPPRASSNRRIIPPSVDALLALLTGIITAGPYRETLVYWPIFIAALLVMSFFNHVLLTIAFGGSIGKLLTGLRTIRISDLEKPTLGQATRRWLWGFFYISYIPIMILTGTDMDHHDIAGLRIVRRIDVRRLKG